jgi:hypothetical protein
VSLIKRRFKVYYLILKAFHEIKVTVIKLQHLLKAKQVRRNILEVLNLSKNNYTIFYYKYYERTQLIIPLSVSMRVKDDETWKLLHFTYNKILKCFLLFFKKDEHYKDHYLFTFIINGKDIVDINFPTEQGPDGKYYNVLNFAHLMDNGYITNIRSDKYLTMPKRKLTCPDFMHPLEEIETFPRIRKSSLQMNGRRKVSFKLNNNNNDLC